MYALQKDIIAYTKKIKDTKRISFSSSYWNWYGIHSALTTQDLLNLGLNNRDTSDIEILRTHVIAAVSIGYTKALL